ncbi:MAG TPA: xylose isomerase [Phycisphaerales bacterium]|nr:xylose isomerase [Phycisphaerales bacterium]HCD34085.1 xylose isomerase [Phycisphaerales bacterium]|tara:strand:- start:2239 stop:3222 length:984 start_codon:yes stop_codon:yes gene_type:complete
MNNQYAVILGNLGNTCDRFLSTGYKDTLDKTQMLEQAASIEGVGGIELVGTWDITPQTVESMQAQLSKLNLKCASIIPDHFSQKHWGRGAFVSKDSGIRKLAVEETCNMIDAVTAMGGDLINLWPGQDGYDYPLSTDYIQDRNWLMETLGECANYAKTKNVRLSLEFKPKEPRNHSYLARTADTLLIANALGDHVGVTIDTGHAFVAYENVGESICLLKQFGDKLFHMHFNDNYTHWDDDMIVGSIHLPEYFEILYWLQKTGYEGWISMDQYPYREDGYGAIRSSIQFLQQLDSILKRVGMDEGDRLLAKRDPVATSTFIRQHLIAH